MSDIKRVLSEHELLRYFVRFIKNLNNKTAIFEMNHIYENPDSFFIEHCGDENIGKLIFPIFVDQKGDGFWALMRRVLAGLIYAEENGLTPVVEFSPNVPYAQAADFLGTDNPFEYYFTQLLPGDWKKSRSIVKTKGVSEGYSGDKLFFAFVQVEERYGGGYKMSEEYLNCLAEMWRKYIRFNERTEKLIKNTDIIERILSRKTLGVHVRGTDYNTRLNGHPVPVSESEHISLAKDLMKKNNYDQVFLATDEQNVVDAFKNEFGNKVVFYDDILRSADGNPVHLTEKEREGHRYLLGIEILKDSYALSCCDGFVCGMSQVSYGVMIMKKADNKSFMDVNVIDRGLNT